MANRLSENRKWNVLLIEAGDVETPLQSVPVAAPYSVFSKFNWGYSAEPQADACLGKRLHQLIEDPAGSSLRNFLFTQDE